MSPDILKKKLAELAEELPTLLTRLAQLFGVRVGGKALGTYMRDAKGEGRRQRADKGPLRIVTGRLARSIAGAYDVRSSSRESYRKVDIDGGMLRFAMGTNTPYAAQHEHGFSGAMAVPGHTRTITQAFGRQISPTQVQVKAHSRNVTIQARPFYGPALTAEEKHIVAIAGGEFSRFLLKGMD